MLSIRFKSFGFLAALSFAMTAASASADTVVTFDDLTLSGGSPSELLVPNGYSGLNWNNFYALNSSTYPLSPSGYTAAVVSGTNVAFDGSDPASITAVAGTTFDLNSGYFTAAWNDNLSVTADAYLGGVLMYSPTFLLSATAPTLENLNFTNVDTVTFSQSGGTLHEGDPGQGLEFAMDNLDVNIVPEPASLSLLAVGAIALLSRRRRRA